MAKWRFFLDETGDHGLGYIDSDFPIFLLAGCLIKQEDYEIFCKQFNERTKDRPGTILPVVLTVFKDKSFAFILKSPPAAVLPTSRSTEPAEPRADPVGSAPLPGVPGADARSLLTTHALFDCAVSPISTSTCLRRTRSSMHRPGAGTATDQVHRGPR